MTLMRTTVGINKAENEGGQLSLTFYGAVLQEATGNRRDPLSPSRDAIRCSTCSTRRWALQETGVNGSASSSRRTVALNLLGAGVGHLGGRRRS